MEHLFLMWLIHVAGTVVLAVNQGLASSHGLFTWLLGPPSAWRLSSQRQEVEVASPFKGKDQNWHGVTSTMFYWSTQSQAQPRFSGRSDTERKKPVWWKHSWLGVEEQGRGGAWNMTMGERFCKALLAMWRSLDLTVSIIRNPCFLLDSCSYLSFSRTLTKVVLEGFHF